MSEPENFLTRWARLKRETVDPAKPEPAEAPASQPAGEDGGKPVSTALPKLPEVDLSALPSIESIAMDTDIRGFLAPGVPPELTRAALRRAWVADPAIRDFIEIAENQWDFTASDSIMGFGPLGPLDDVRKLVAQAMGDLTELAESTKKDEKEAAKPKNEVENGPLAAEPPAATTQVARVALKDDAALQQNEQITAISAGDSQPEENAAPRRRHGGALPQ